MPTSFRTLAVLVPVLLGCALGCANGRPAMDVRVVTSEPSSEVDAVVNTFFAAGPSSPDFAEQLASALRKYPTSGALHEVAGYLARLDGNDHASWENFLLAAADTRNANAALDILEAIRGSHTHSEEIATVDALARIAEAHPDPDVRARANYTRAMELRLLGRPDEARRAMASLGVIVAFDIVGAFDNEDGKGFAEAYPPESKVDLSATMAGSSVPIRWRRADASDLHGALTFRDVVYPNQQAVAYAVVWAEVPADTAATLRVSAEGPVAAWLDHTEVVREDRVRAWALDNVAAPITLRAGWHEVLVKSAIKTGPWALTVRITDRAGNLLPNLVTSVTSSPATSAGGAVVHEGATSEQGPSDARMAFAKARGLVARGLYQPGLAGLEKLLRKAPTNPLLRFFTADAAERDHQIERAMDLLTSGISKDAAWPSFLQERASLYTQKGLYKQAMADLLRAIAQRPEARFARLDLADVLDKHGWQTDRAKVLSEVVARWPDWASAYTHLAAARAAQSYRSSAEDAYEKATTLEPGNLHAIRMLRAIAQDREQGGKAEEMFHRASEIAPSDVDDQLAHAEYERTRGRLNDAEARLAALSQQSPEHPTSYLRRAQIAEERGQSVNALALFEKAADRDPRDSWLAERLQQLKPAADDALAPYLPSDEEIETAIRMPTTKGDAACHVEELLDDDATLVNADGSVRLVRTEVVRPLTQHGRDELVRIALPGSGKVRVLRAFAQTPDGKRQDASSVETGSVRFRNLDVGSTVVLQYVSYPRRTGALADDYYADMIFSKVARHVDRMRWVIVAPKAKSLYFDVDPRVTQRTVESGSWIARQFIRENVSASPAEVGMTPFSDWQPHVVVSTLPSWDAFIRWEKAVLDESFPADPGIDALALKLTAGATTARDKLGKLFAYVAQEIRYQQEYESILAGWQPHRSSVVLERKYGDCKDKSTLLIALAKAVGLRVEFAVLATHHLGHPDRKVVLPTFNHAIAYVPEQPGVDAAFFLDPTVDALDLWNLREDDQGATGLVLDPTNGTWTWIDIPYQAATFQTEDWKVEVNVESPEEAHAHLHLAVRGSRASALRTALRNEDQSRQIYDYLTSLTFPGGKLASANAPDHESLLHPLVIDAEIEVGPSIRQEGEHFRLKFPNQADEQPIKLLERQTPLDLGAPRSGKTEIVVHLAKGVKLVDKPAPLDIVDPCFHMRRAVGGDKTTVTITDDFEQTCTRVSVEDYPRYRATLEHVRSLLDSAVVFDKVQEKAPTPSASARR